ncbi:MAG: thioredoxin-disulfide reductase [Bacillota bacterium]
MIDIAIIGGGPAGLTAGLYAARSGLKSVLFEEVFVGGQAARTPRIDNYPGFAEGIDGATLGMNIEQQAMRFGLEIRYDPVSKLELKGDVKKIHTQDASLEARTVIIATGASPNKLGLEKEQELTGSGISYCATCDGAFFKGKAVAVVGGGDTAVSDAIYLARYASKVYLIHRRDKLRADEILQKAVLTEPNVELVFDSEVRSLLGEESLSGIMVHHKPTGDLKQIDVQGLFVAVGIRPRTDLVRDVLELTEDGYIQTDALMQTSIEGVYAAGDVRNTPLRQVVTAVADGAVAATQAAERCSLK